MTDADQDQVSSPELDLVVKGPFHPALGYLVSKLQEAGISVKNEVDATGSKESYGIGPYGEPVADIAGLVLQFFQDNIHLILPRALDIAREALGKVFKIRSASIVCVKVTRPDGTILSSRSYNGPASELTTDAVRSILDPDSG